MSNPLPVPFLQSLEGSPGFDKEGFLAAHEEPRSFTSLRINPAKLPGTTDLDFSDLITGKVPWSDQGYYLSERPSFTFDPLFHAGCYYVQEASSMFLEQVLIQCSDLSKPLRVLDLSAAPGGKSTHIQSLISPASILVSNEVIRSRAKTLQDQVIKWGASNVVVTNNDPRDFSRLESYFDVILVDAPCSGSGLFRRDPDAIDQWSPEHVQLCSQRQQRILADVWPALKRGGLLIYSTCSYSVEENEQVAEWIRREFSVTDLPVMADPDWGLTETGGGFRFWPDKVKGEGLYMIAFGKNEGEADFDPLSRKKIPPVSTAQRKMLDHWIDPVSFDFVSTENNVYAWPLLNIPDFETVLSALRVLYSGIRVGNFVRDKFIPDHALALSGHLPEKFPRIDLDKTHALDYLGKKDIHTGTTVKGWQVVRYRGHELGWINVLSNRINNYYPKELRILKDPPR